MNPAKKIIIPAIVSLFLVVFSVVLIGSKLGFFEKYRLNGSFFCKDCNVILITLTNLRYDHVSGNGYFRFTTPNLDAFAEESLIFDNAFSQSSWTLPEGISIFTSLYPYQHGLMNRFDGKVLAEKTPTLIDILGNKGYKTAAFTGGFDYDAIYGLTSRLEEYQECKEKEPVGQEYGKIQCAIPKAVEWIKKNQDKKFFVHIQGYDTHCPFNHQGGNLYDKDYQGTVDFSECLWTFGPSEPVTKAGKKYYPVFSPATKGQASILLGEDDIRHLVALYDESINLSDEVLGSFFKEIKNLGLEKNTIIVFTSEHGDIFGKHGRFMRGGPLRGTFYDDVLHVPLIIKHPKLGPARLDGLAEHIDIVPTLLDFLEIKKDSFFQGKSLLPLVLENKEVHDYVFAATEYHPAEDNPYFNEKTRIETIRNKEWKLIKETVFSKNFSSSTLELYDMVNDKEELYNLADTQKNIFDDLQSRLSDWSKNIQKKEL